MDYKSILSRIEEQKKNEELSTKLYRYSGLIHAIEFFSQKLNLDQIVDAGFDFVNELLLLDKSAVFMLQGNNYVLKKLKGCSSEITLLKNSEKLQNLAVFHGTIIYDQPQLAKFFEQEFLEAYHVTTVIPLIVENVLIGFILISSETVQCMSGDNYIISEALMRLFNNAIENYKRYEELQQTNRELDEKVFNLFAINHSSKALLSELNLDVLYNLSVDVFSELMQSSVTGLFLYDEKSEKYVLKAYKDVFHSENNISSELTLAMLARVDMGRMIIDTSNSNDIIYFNSIFIEGIAALEQLQPQYIVVLVKNGKVLGLVLLGRTVTGMDYKTSMFELIESLASATYIAVSNAQLFKQVSEQKKVIQSKLNKLISLNNLMKNINSALKVETLLELTMKTLEVSFEAEKGLIALYNKEKDVFDITNILNIETEIKEIKPNSNWKRVFEGDAIFEVMEETVSEFVGNVLAEDVGVCPGMLIVPIFIERVDIDVMGVIIIFKYLDVPINDEENLLTIETVAGHLAPVMSNLKTIEEQKRFLLPNYIELFKRDLREKVAEALEYKLELEIMQVLDTRDLIFKGNTIADNLQEIQGDIYPFTNNNFFIIKGKDGLTDKDLKRITGIDSLEVKRYSLRKDFNSYKEFFELFQ